MEIHRSFHFIDIVTHVAREEEEDSSNSSSLSTSDSLELLRQSAQKHDPLSGMELLFGSEEMTKFALALDTPKGTAYAQRKEAKIPRVRN